mmetsp:Transcript_28805/g.95733  ORF Transcript_28805/g.95733 Transcript_28805/m.95733 type:complete len:227 (-) Transcript_28805:8-688(-)
MTLIRRPPPDTTRQSKNCPQSQVRPSHRSRRRRSPLWSHTQRRLRRRSGRWEPMTLIRRPPSLPSVESHAASASSSPWSLAATDFGSSAATGHDAPIEELPAVACATVGNIHGGRGGGGGGCTPSSFRGGRGGGGGGSSPSLDSLDSQAAVAALVARCCSLAACGDSLACGAYQSDSWQGGCTRGGCESISSVLEEGWAPKPTTPRVATNSRRASLPGGKQTGNMF